MKTGETAKYRQVIRGYKKGSFKTGRIALGYEWRCCLDGKILGLAVRVDTAKPVWPTPPGEQAS